MPRLCGYPLGLTQNIQPAKLMPVGDDVEDCAAVLTRLV